MHVYVFMACLVPKSKNNHFIALVISKIVEFDILFIFISCLVPKLSYYRFFKIAIAAIFDL